MSVPTPRRWIINRHKNWATMTIKDGGGTNMFAKGDRIVVDNFYFVVVDVAWFQITVVPYDMWHWVADRVKWLWNEHICWWNF